MSTTHRIVTLVETLLELEGDAGIRELALRAGIPKSSVQRLLTDLQEKGWVNQDPKTQTYHIALRFLTLANASRLKQELLRTTGRVMDELCERSNQTILLLVLEGARGICLHRVEPERTLRLVAEVGKTFDLHAAACGKILLAFAPLALQEKIFAAPLRRFTDTTITSGSALQKELEKIRECGFAVSFEEMTPNTTEIAVPLRDPQGNLIAALSIVGFRFDMEHRLPEFRELLENAAHHIMKNTAAAPDSAPAIH